MRIASILSMAPISPVSPSSRPTASTTSSGNASSPSSGSSQTQIAALNAAEDILAAVYTTTVSGKNYSGSVEQSNGEYIGTVPNLPGASASGSSIQSAENNLGAVIDTLV
jgi:hypothetical protein